MILDIPVQMAVELGRTRISIRNLLQLNQGSVVELERAAGEPLDVFVNVAGGVRVDEPGMDLAVALAVASSAAYGFME